MMEGPTGWPFVFGVTIRKSNGRPVGPFRALGTDTWPDGPRLLELLARWAEMQRRHQSPDNN